MTFKSAYLVMSVMSATALSPASLYAQVGTFPCDAFRMMPNGMLQVVKDVTIQGPNGSVRMSAGAVSFGPGMSYGGVSIYALYQQYCR